MNAQHRDPRPKRRSILFSAPMVRAILAGEKTVTRRVVKPQPPVDTDYVSADEDPRGRGALCVSGVEGGEFAEGIDPWRRCPYGAPGDHLWVRETWRPDASHDPDDTIYRADVCAERIAEFDGIVKWHSSRFMPRVRSRITLDVVSVRVGEAVLPRRRRRDPRGYPRGGRYAPLRSLRRSVGFDQRQASPVGERPVGVAHRVQARRGADVIAGERGLVGELEAQLAAALAENARLTRERDEACAAVERVRAEGEATAHRLHACRDEAVAELDAARATMAGRMTAPTLQELAAHVCSQGVVLAWLRIVEGCFPTIVQGHTARVWVRDTPRCGRPVRWVPLDAEGFPCAWPVVEEAPHA